jgi:hypothetical protein
MEEKSVEKCEEIINGTIFSLNTVDIASVAPNFYDEDTDPVKMKDVDDKGNQQYCTNNHNCEEQCNSMKKSENEDEHKCQCHESSRECKDIEKEKETITSTSTSISISVSVIERNLEITPAKPCKENCSICWSPMVINAKSPPSPKQTQTQTQTQTLGDMTPKSTIAERKEKKMRSVTKTKCGHIFHKKCLLETKLRKAECPNCRTQLTPITNPITIHNAMNRDRNRDDRVDDVQNDLFQANLTDAVIHAAHRGRNAVRAKLLEQERLQQQQQQQQQ